MIYGLILMTLIVGPMSTRKFAKHLLFTVLSLAITIIIVVAAAYAYLFTQLPDVATLNNPQMQVPLRVYTADGQLVGEFGDIRRSPVSLDQIPKQMIQAVLATEDQRYFEHPGVDVFGLFRAARELAITGKKSQGASTITMQVARNFFLTRKKTYSRKLNEILLALKIDHELSKEKILELYLNKIYLGQHAYGVAAAAEIYYGKKLNELTLPEMAMIAGLPQAPSRDNPITNPRAATERRNHVLERMQELGYIDKATYQRAIATPDTASYHGQKVNVNAPYVAEMVRAAMVDHYGEAAYTDGYKVITTVDSRLQEAANQALRDGILAYDRRHGYRGPEQNWGLPPRNLLEWADKLEDIPTINHLRPAAIVKINADSANALLSNGQIITIPWSTMTWARRYIDNKYLGAAPKQVIDVVKLGDVVRVQQVKNEWAFSALPQVEGSIIAMNPNTGAVNALVGGFSFQQSHFNRSTQALRQPGSNFKPFVYAAALDKGFTLATIINDAPVVQEQPGQETWRPTNHDLKFYGPTRLRVGLIESRNLTSIRLLQETGIRYTLDYLARFGFDPNKLPHSLSLALGSGSVTPLQIANGYAVFANGGYRVTPYLIDKVMTENDQVLYQAHLPIVCDTCESQNLKNVNGYPVAPRAITAQNAFLITSALQDVIRRGTGEGALVLHRNDVSGKTGTTNDQLDAWFSGFNSDLVASVWIGFDNPTSLYEYGAQAAIPIWVEFMEQALAGKPEHVMAQPSGIVSVRIDPNTGMLAGPEQKNAVFEYFTEQTSPTSMASQNSNPSTNFDAGDNASAQLF